MMLLIANLFAIFFEIRVVLIFNKIKIKLTLCRRRDGDEGQNEGRSKK
jgi:hypothetical protein